MGILNLFGKNDADRQPPAAGRVKGPCATLQDHGIDPAGLKFTLNEDGSVTVAGHARDESERNRICRVIEAMPLVEGVRNQIVIAETRVEAVQEALVNY